MTPSTERGMIVTAALLLSALFLSMPLAAIRSRSPFSESGRAAATAVVTFVSTPEQERAARALIQSIHKLGGALRASAIYVVTANPVQLPCESLRLEGVEVLPLEMERAFRDYPLALKAFAAAQVEKRVKAEIDTLIWLDPGVIVISSLEHFDLDGSRDVAVRPVTLANAIGIPPGSKPDEYWDPIYAATGVDGKTLPALKTIADEVPIQPYYNCEAFSFRPKLGIAAEWARQLARLLKDIDYQRNACTTFLRKLFLHQAVLSAVISAYVRPERIKALPLASGYPFSQHGRLPAAHKARALDDLAVVIFDRTWQQDPSWLDRMGGSGPLKDWLAGLYSEYQAGGEKN